MENFIFVQCNVDDWVLIHYDGGGLIYSGEVAGCRKTVVSNCHEKSRWEFQVARKRRSYLLIARKS